MSTDDPLPGVRTHGAAGYKKGCRCFTCRRGKADAQAKFRRNSGRSEHPAGKRLQIPEGAGVVETRIRTQFHALNVNTPEAETLKDLGYITARLIDQIQNTGKWHLLVGAQKALLDCSDRLMKLGKPAAGSGPLERDEVDDFLASLGQEPPR